MIEMIVFIAVVVAVIVGWIVHFILLNRKITASENRYDSFFHNSPIAMISVDSEYKITRANSAVSALFGYSISELRGRNIVDVLVSDTDRSYMNVVFQKALKDSRASVKNYNTTKDDRELFCEWSIATIDGGELVCAVSDITYLQSELDRLEKASMAMERSSSATIYTDSKSYIEYVSPSFKNLYLDDDRDIIGMHIGDYLFGDKVAFAATVSGLDKNNSYKGTVTKSSRGEAKTLSVMLSMFSHKSRLISYIANLHDITYLSTQISDMAYKVQHDSLTGAVNRATLNDRLSQAIKRSNRFKTKIALFFIDLNDFKIINDTHGHDVGDLLLKSVAKNIMACLRTTDTVCRYGGDEFIAMLEDIRSNEHLDAILNTINIAISEPVKVDSTLTIVPKASVGFSLYPDNALTLDELIKVADEAMYIEKAKKKQNSSRSR